MKLKGRGALSNRPGRFAAVERERDRDSLETEFLDGELPTRIPTQLHIDTARTIIARNESPDVGFRQSINPYRGCEHGCVYCYARATHAYYDLSPGHDFESQLFYKPNAVELLRAELASHSRLVEPIALGTNTDPYQPVERELRITRAILELFAETKHPTTIVTKSGLILRDLDVLERLAADGLVAVFVSLTTLDDELKRRLEPRTAGPAQRLRVIRELTRLNIPTGVLAAPIIPAVNDHELEALLERAAEAGARAAGYVLLRLPHEVKDLFIEWLREHYPDRADHVLSLLRQMHGGALYDSRYHDRQRGRGPLAALLQQRFRRTQRKLGLDREFDLNASLFQRPRALGGQLDLWGG
jgi:DNA repair photolyase